MDYGETLQYLEEVQGRGIKLGLRNISSVLAAMGDPQSACPAVVVAGTNGKGSVSAMLGSILRAEGRRVGLYTSPHLIRYEERIAVDGRPVTAEQFAAAISEVRATIERLLAASELESHPTHFEILTAAAFHHFRSAGTDVAVMEVGMGGRLDAVTVARARVSVITNVTLEHTKFLGDTVEAIAREKAGVIRDGSTVILGDPRPEVLRVVESVSKGRGVRLIERHRAARVSPSAAGTSGRFRLETDAADYGELVVSLAGRHQVENAVLAVLAAEALHDAGLLAPDGLPPDAVIEGLAAANWPGRLQIVGHDPLFILDGAHNPGGCAVLARFLSDLVSAGRAERICLILGVLSGKDLGSMLEPLESLAERIIVTRGVSSRFLAPEEVAGACRRRGIDPVVAGDLATALEAARGWASPRDAVCLAGSLYLVGDALAALGIEPFS